jgi:hypothetical protein
MQLCFRFLQNSSTTFTVDYNPPIRSPDSAVGIEFDYGLGDQMIGVRG